MVFSCGLVITNISDEVTMAVDVLLATHCGAVIMRRKPAALFLAPEGEYAPVARRISWRTMGCDTRCCVSGAGVCW